MSRIDEIDRNMAVITRIDDPEIEWFDVHDAPFRLNGFLDPQQPDRPFFRLREDVAKATSEGVAGLAGMTAGCRVRFRTDSPCVAVHAEMPSVTRFDHMTVCGVSGFDLYEHIDGEECYSGTFRPDACMTHGYESKLELRTGGMHELTINFPLYNHLDRLFVGLKRGSTVSAPRAYAHPVPVVFYGSSITQGGCASRPGNSYQAMLSRMLDFDYVNLGFSGSAQGEKPIVDYMAGLTMSVFVCDYDHNAPTPEHLEKTHLPLYRAVRDRQPDLPILLLSRPNRVDWPDAVRRRRTIEATFETALREGDRNIRYINGSELLAGPLRDSCTVDDCHPNDLGFYRMAARIAPVLEELLGG